MYYLKARYYSPELGRFLTKDTFRGFNNNPSSLNLYAYANGNPIKNVDPDGHYAAAIYFVPGVGQVALAATGAAVATYGLVKGGSWVYNKASDYMVNAKGGKQRVRDTGLSQLTDQQVYDLARDKSLSSKERERYVKEEKARKQRNVQKRK